MSGACVVRNEMTVKNNLKVVAGEGKGAVAFSNTERFSLIGGRARWKAATTLS